MSASPRRTGSNPRDDDWRGLARRLGIDLERPAVDGPIRSPLAGATDETPLEKMMRLSTQMELLAAEVGSLASATYRAQLWQQWYSLLHARPEYRAWRARVGPGADPHGNPFA